jgi:response regulator RpfG family c-di-GMP phosphodiesterase
MAERILLVDDELAILEGYQRLLRREFQTDIAVGGPAALAAIQKEGPYAVVVSDMRMPEMDGAQLLAKVKAMSPDTIRVMLTGAADMQTAVSAVNEGSIFRFLTKPCTKETLAKTLTAGLVQHRLVIAEKELLEQTLSGSIHVLTEVLSLVNPAAFGRAMRLRRYIHHIVNRLALGSPWKFEVAAMMSQLGCVTIDPETIDAVYAGQKLSPEEQSRYEAHPLVARDLLSSIPRMEPIAWMIAHQNHPAPLEGDIANREQADMRRGAEILRAALAFDEFLRKAGSKTEALHRLSRQHRDLDPRVLQALVEFEPDAEEIEVCAYAIDELAPGMVLHEEVRTSSGSLIVSKGQETTVPLLLKLKNLHAKGAIGGSVNIAISKLRAAAASP